MEPLLVKFLRRKSTAITSRPPEDSRRISPFVAKCENRSGI